MNPKIQRCTPQKLISTLLFAWLLAVLTEYALCIMPLTGLEALTGMSFQRVILLTIGLFIFLTVIARLLPKYFLRWGIAAAALGLSSLSLAVSYSLAFLCACLLLSGIAVCFAIFGWKDAPMPEPYTGKASKFCSWITALLAVGFFLFVSIWTVYRVYTFTSPTYDFGIFSQMFYNMKTSGLPMTTLERDGLLSHFKVHMSPIYYLLLPFYWLVPVPATLQVLQAAILASSVIPLWLLGKRHGLSPVLRTLLCGLLLLYPAYSGGTSYDIHENAFLTPLILWLFYALDNRKNTLTAIFTLLVLMVKEDAAVYTAVIGLFVLLRSLLRKEGSQRTVVGLLILSGSIGWFLCTTGYLASSGDGVMTYRYSNFMYDGSSSLITVIKAVLMCPLKAIYECVDGEKLKFIGYTLLPLLGLPFLTRRYERLLLLIPYMLVNLMSDYQYQHDIFFQYTFGSTAFLFYLVLVNLADIKHSSVKIGFLVVAAALSLICLNRTVIPVAASYPQRYQDNKETYQQVHALLDDVPQDATVAASTHYTVPLSQREAIYDVRYTTWENLLRCEYIVLSVTNESSYKNYADSTGTGFENLTDLLLDSGYVLHSQVDGTVQIYTKSPPE